MVIVVIAAVLVLAHTLAASIGIFAVSAMIFLIMYIFYIRLAPKMAFVVLLTPIAFVLKIPFLVPVACALIYTPVSLVPMSCGTVVFYMVEYLKRQVRHQKHQEVKRCFLRLQLMYRKYSRIRKCGFTL